MAASIGIMPWIEQNAIYLCFIMMDFALDVQTSGLMYIGTNNSTLVVFISATQPQQGTANAANWLPAPSNAGFQLILRLYEAPASVLNNDYEPPAVVRTSTTTATATSG